MVPPPPPRNNLAQASGALQCSTLTATAPQASSALASAISTTPVSNSNTDKSDDFSDETDFDDVAEAETPIARVSRASSSSGCPVNSHALQSLPSNDSSQATKKRKVNTSDKEHDVSLVPRMRATAKRRETAMIEVHEN